MPLLEPCPAREQLLKKAASARRDHGELKRKAGIVIGTEEYQAVNDSARAALNKAEIAVNEYINHLREHGCERDKEGIEALAGNKERASL